MIWVLMVMIINDFWVLLMMTIKMKIIDKCDFINNENKNHNDGDNDNWNSRWW